MTDTCDLAHCIHHPSKRIEFFCLSSEYSERLFCSLCIVKSLVPCKPSELVDIEDYLATQRSTHSSKGTSDMSELTNFLSQSKHNEAANSESIQEQLQILQESLLDIQTKLTNTLGILQAAAETQLKSAQSSVSAKVTALASAVQLVFSNSLMGNYRSFKDLTSAFETNQPDGLLKMLVALQEDQDARDEQLQERKKELLQLQALRKCLPQINLETIKSIEEGCSKFEEILGKATTSIVKIVGGSTTIEAPYGFNEQLQLQQLGSSRFENTMRDGSSTPLNRSQINRSMRSSGMGSPLSSRISEIRRVVCSANFVSGHSRQITAVCCYSTNQSTGLVWNRVATGSEDNTIRLWDLDTMECLDCLKGHQQGIRDIIQLPDGIIASASYDKTIKLWNTTAGGIAANTLKGHLSGVICLMLLSPNILASGSADYTIKLWDISKGETLRTISGHTSDVMCLATTQWQENQQQTQSSQEQLMISGSSDNTIIVWQLNSRRRMNKTSSYAPTILHQLISHSDYISSLVVLSDNCTLASGSYDSTIKLWNLRTGQLLTTLLGHQSYIHKIGLYSDRVILSASADGTLRFWDTTIKSHVHTLEGHQGAVNSFAILNDSSIWSVGIDQNVHVWD